MLDINTFFDKIYYINMEHRTDRNENVLKNFETLGITNYKKITPTPPDQIDEETLPTVKVFLSSKKWKRDIEFRYNTIVRSCALAHRRCMNHAFRNNYERILIFEDDFCIVNEDYENALQKCMEFMETNDWGLFYLDNIESMERDGDGAYFNEYKKEGSQDIKKIAKLFAHSYCVNKKAIRYFNRKALNYGGHVDRLYKNSGKRVFSNYFFQDGIFSQNNMPSDLSDDRVIISDKKRRK